MGRSATLPAVAASSSPEARIERRVARCDWTALGEELDARGYAVTPPLLAAADCRALAGLFEREGAFRSTIDLRRHAFGENGRYRYFARPLPGRVETLRRTLYPPLARIANGWQRKLGRDERYPARLGGYLRRCKEAGQTRPTPLLFRYAPGGYNCLHQDLYGELAFPLQAMLMLSRPGVDFEGGEFLLVEQRPRMQSRGAAVPLERGRAVLFPNRERPVQGRRGPYRVQVRHGTSPVRSGERMAVGIIFHDAR